MSAENDIRQNLRTIVGSAPIATYAAKVTAVNGAECSVVRIADDMAIDEVKLNATCTDGRGIVIHPTVGSIVLITSIDGVQWFVSMFEQIDTIVINGGTHPICYADTLKSELQKMSNRIDVIIDALKTALTGSQDGGATYKSNIATKLATITQTEDFSNIENTNIKH